MNGKDTPVGPGEKGPFLEKIKITDNDDRILSKMEDEDDIIELTDILAPAPSEDKDAYDLSDEIDLLSKSDPDDIMELTDEADAPAVVLEDAFVLDQSDEEERLDDLLKGTLHLDDVVEEERIGESDRDDHFMQNLGMALDVSHDDSEPISADILAPDDGDKTPSISLAEDQIEAAIERVIKRIFSEKIERMLVEVVERTVKQEIEKLKRLIEDAANDR